MGAPFLEIGLYGYDMNPSIEATGAPGPYLPTLCDFITARIQGNNAPNA